MGMCMFGSRFTKTHHQRMLQLFALTGCRDTRKQPAGWWMGPTSLRKYTTLLEIENMAGLQQQNWMMNASWELHNAIQLAGSNVLCLTVAQGFHDCYHKSGWSCVRKEAAELL